MKKLLRLVTLFGFSVFMLSACDGESQLFEDAVEIRNLQITSLNVTPPENAQAEIFLNTNEQISFGIQGLQADGGTLVLSASGRQWSVSDPAVAAIDANGLLTARANGAVSVFVSIGDLVSVPFTLTVSNATLSAIETIEGELLIERCLPQNYLAIGRFDDGTVRNLSSVSWSIGNATNARVVNNPDATATLTGVDPGALSLNATAGDISATMPSPITVRDTLSALTISPSSAVVDVDESQVFTASGTYDDQPATADAPAIGRRTVVISDSVEWAITSGTSNATVNNVSPNKGTLTGVASGSTVLSASCGALAVFQTIVISSTDSDDSDELSFNTTDNPLLIALSDLNGFQLQVSTGSVFSEDDDVTDEVSWTVAPVGSTTASISLLETGTNAGLVRPNATGDAIVTASLDGQSISITVRVSVVIP